MEIVDSINEVPIRLTDERWEHIVEARPYMRGAIDQVLDTIESPQFVLRAKSGVQVAVRSYGRNGYLHVIYREISAEDGFIITAYFKKSFNRRLIIWREDEQ